MKTKLLRLTCLMILSLSFAFAETSTNKFIPICNSVGVPHAITSNHYNADGEWIIRLEDRSYWQLFVLKKRKSTWLEWWQNTPAFDDHFFFDPRTWSVSNHIQIYEVLDDTFKAYKYVLKNIETEDRVFATHLHQRCIPTLEFAQQFFNCPWGKEVRISCNKHYMNNILILEDQTIWKLFLVKNWQAWWQPLQAETDPFLCSLAKWEIGDALQIYFSEDQEAFIPLNYTSKEKNEKIYLIHNKSKEQFMYGISISLAHLLDYCHEYSLKQWEKGYEKGYSDGDF